MTINGQDSVHPSSAAEAGLRPAAPMSRECDHPISATSASKHAASATPPLVDVDRELALRATALTDAGVRQDFHRSSRVSVLPPGLADALEFRAAAATL